MSTSRSGLELRLPTVYPIPSWMAPFRVDEVVCGESRWHQGPQGLSVLSSAPSAMCHTGGIQLHREPASVKATAASPAGPCVPRPHRAEDATAGSGSVDAGAQRGSC